MFAILRGSLIEVLLNIDKKWWEYWDRKSCSQIVEFIVEVSLLLNIRLDQILIKFTN